MKRAIDEAISRATGQSALAARVGSTPSMVWQWQRGKRPISPAFCVKIEQATGISRRDLRPSDWWAIWPELIDDAHPAPPTATEPTEQQAA